MEKIISDLKNTAKSAVKKSSELLEISKLKVALYDTQGEIDKAFKNLGKLVYDSQKEADTDSINILIGEIDKLYEKLAEQERHFALLRNEKKCEACGHVSSEKAVFCSECGEKF